MAVDFSAFNKQFDTDKIAAEEQKYAEFQKEQSEKGGNFSEVPSGVYPVELSNMEKRHVTFPSGDETDQISIDFKIIEGKYQNQHIFYNGTFNDNFAHGIDQTARLISELTDKQVTIGTIRLILESEDCEEKILDIYQMLSGNYNYDLDYKVTKSKKLNPRTNEPYTNKFYSIKEVFDNAQ